MLTTRVTPSTRPIALLALLGVVSLCASADTPAPMSHPSSESATTQDLDAQRLQMLQKLQQLERDNERLRQQLEQVEPSANVEALQQVLNSHTRIIERLRQSQDSQPSGFDHRQYDSPAAQGPALPVTRHDAANPPAAASMWSLEMAGASGVLALIGALVLLFVITVLRKSYWMPRKAIETRPAAKVSPQGLAADVARNYRGQDNADRIEVIASEPKPAKRPSRKQAQAQAREDAALAQQDQDSMARMLEQGLQLDGDDLDLFGGAPSTAVAAAPSTEPSTAPANTELKPKMPAAQRDQGQSASAQPKSPRANEYDLLGSDSAFDDDNEFDELFEAATQVSEADPAVAKPVSCMSNNDKKLFDEEVIRRIREKTFDYVPPVDTEGYIVEEGCDDLDKYMDIEFIAPPKVQMCDAKEQRDRDAKRDA